jgi:major type 1 subunit fimbrin (pilin)
MKQLIKFSIAAAIATSCATFAANAADNQVDFTGILASSSCNVSVNGGDNTVDMGLIDTSGMGAGEITDDVAFSVDIKNCPTTLQTAVLQFQGTAFDGNSALYSITKPSGNQQDHIALQIKDTNSQGYINPNTESAYILSQGNVSIPLAASMKLVKDGVDDGAFTVSTTLHIDYK